MALVTAAQLKATERPEFTIGIGDGREVRVRRPDMPLLVLQGKLPTPLFASVLKLVGEWAGVATQDVTEAVIEKNEDVRQFVDMFVCEAMVNPRVVRTIDEVDENTVLVSDLTLLTKRAILNGVMAETQRRTQEVVADAQTFPTGGSGEGVGSDVPTLQPASV